MGPERPTQRLTTLDAMRLHEDTPPERWCVCKADLQLLKMQASVLEPFWMLSEVLKAIQDGRIAHSAAGKAVFEGLRAPRTVKIVMKRMRNMGRASIP